MQIILYGKLKIFGFISVDALPALPLFNNSIYNCYT